MKNFDIYLRNRLTECDILISSLTLYDDGLAADSRLIVESCLEKYLLYKVIAVKAGSELVSHIDDMIKTCYEKLRLKTRIGASAEFTEHVWSDTDGSGMVIGAKKFKLKAKTYEQFVDQVEIAVERLTPLATKYIEAEVALPIDAEVDEFTKTGYIMPENTMIVAAEANAMKQVFEESVCGLELGADMKDLLYRIYCAGEHVMQIAASVTETSTVKHIGASGDLYISADVEVSEEKFANAEAAILMLIDITGVLMKLIVPDENIITLDAYAATMLRRKRRLSEIDAYDPITNMTNDDMDTLTALDFIVLEE